MKTLLQTYQAKAGSMYSAVLIFVSALAALPAYAVSSDSKQATDIKAEHMAFDEVKQISSFTGNVVVTRGTLLMKAGKLTMSQDPMGYQYATLQAGGASVASFRQKRDGGDLWVEGHADRIEYDDKTELVRFYSRAKLKRLDGKTVTDEVSGELIVYDSRREVFTVQNSQRSNTNSDKRINTVIQPRMRPEAQGKPQ